jgi:hypothetical protein
LAGGLSDFFKFAGGFAMVVEVCCEEKRRSKYRAVNAGHSMVAV